MLLYLLVIIDRPYYMKTIKHTVFKNCDKLCINGYNRAFKHLQSAYSRSINLFSYKGHAS
jgi:hypothetical protein